MIAVNLAEQRIASAFADVHAVEQVYVRHAGDIVCVLTVVGDDSDDVRDAIYDRERELIRQFPSSGLRHRHPHPFT